MACFECRDRRTRCDNAEPKCGRCARLSKKCEYAATVRRRGPTKRSVKGLEERLANIEAQLNAASYAMTTLSSSNETRASADAESTSPPDPNDDVEDALFSEILQSSDTQTEAVLLNEEPEWPSSTDALTSTTTPATPSTSSDMARLPELQEAQELHDIFFDLVYPSMPIVHPANHDPTRLLSSSAQPPLALKCIMWAHAASRSTKYAARATGYYQVARMHLEYDEAQSDGFAVLTLAHVQAWALLASFEMFDSHFVKGFMSYRRAIVLSQMLGLHEVDTYEELGAGFVNILRPPKNAIEAEERRRTFWLLYISDCWASSANRKPISVRNVERSDRPIILSSGGFSSYGDIERIASAMPCSEAAFDQGTFESTQTLREAAAEGLRPTASPFTALALSGYVLQRCTQHLKQAQSLAGAFNEQQFWLSHQQLDHMLSEALSQYPLHLRPSETDDPLALFVHTCYHRWTISLFQAAECLLQDTPYQDELTAQFRARARNAATEIVETIKSKMHIGIKKMYPFLLSTLSIAATVFTYDFRHGIDADYARSALKFTLDTIMLWGKQWKLARISVTQFFEELKEHDIDVSAIMIPTEREIAF